MELALSTEGIDGVVLDPWSHSATLDGALLNGLLHAGHTPEDPGDEKADAGREAARSKPLRDVYKRQLPSPATLPPIPALRWPT